MEYFLGFLIAYAIDGVIFGFITSYVASSKGYSDGFAWGFFLGLIGLLVVGFRPALQQEPAKEYKPMYNGALQISAKETQTKGWTCSCGAKNPYTLDYCLACRRSRAEIKPIAKMPCPHCGATNNATNTLCYACSKSMADTAATEIMEEPKAALTAGNDATDLLEKLARLHSEGILTDEEFTRKKADVLAKM